jgi:glutathione S-transferase
MGPVYEKWSGEKFATMMADLEKSLTKGKFICGDNLTVFDIHVGGFFTDLVLNPHNKGAAHWATAWEKAPDRVKQYVADFKADFGDYFANRPESQMGI